MNPLVSIIIPAYNVEKYILDTINSVLAQTHKNIEIIIIDDGSTDGTLELIKPLSSKKIKIFTQKNKGASVARNKGIEHAEGEYIQFLDADDLINNIKIEDQVKLLSSNPHYLSLCHTVHFDDGNNPSSIPIHHEWFSSGSNNPVDFLIKLYGGGLIGANYGGMVQPNAWLTPKKIIDEIGPWNEMRNPDDDGEFFCRAILASKGIIYSFEGVNYYRKFKTSYNLSAKNSYISSLNLLKSTELKARHLLAKTNDQNAKLALSRLFWENSFIFYPQYKDLCHRAIGNAKILMPDYKPNFYQKGIKKILAMLFGWQLVRKLQHFKALKKSR